MVLMYSGRWNAWRESRSQLAWMELNVQRDIEPGKAKERTPDVCFDILVWCCSTNFGVVLDFLVSFGCMNRAFTGFLGFTLYIVLNIKRLTPSIIGIQLVI